MTEGKRVKIRFEYFDFQDGTIYGANDMTTGGGNYDGTRWCNTDDDFLQFDHKIMASYKDNLSKQNRFCGHFPDGK